MKMKFRRKILIAYIHHIQNQGYFYGIGKIHEALDGAISNFRPILSVQFCPTYELVKFCNKLPKAMATDDFDWRGSFSLAEETEGFVSHLVMAILM